MNSLQLEKHYPWMLGLSACMLAYFFGLTPAAGVEGKDMLSGALAMGAIFTGFTATILSVLTGVSTDNTRKLRSSGFWPLFVEYLGYAIKVSGIYCIVCLLGFFLPLKDDTTKKITDIGEIYFSLWGGLTVMMLASFFRVLEPFINLIKSES